jgi:hypothetical protein
MTKRTYVKIHSVTRSISPSSGNAFSIDDDIINKIVEERSGPARKQVSNFEARGNFNAIGGQKANDFLTGQVGQATDKVKQIGQSITGRYQGEVDSIRDNASSQASGYKLGDDLFDVTPFEQQREKLVSERQGSFGQDVSTALGSDPLFDITGALQKGGKVQGQVSGAPNNQSFLDTIAQREGSIASKNRRGVGTRGSGTF